MILLGNKKNVASPNGESNAQVLDTDGISEQSPPPWEFILFGVLIIINLIPIWAFPFFPSQDGPIHLSIAQTIKDYLNPEYNVIQEYYKIDWSFNRNIFLSLTLLSLTKIFPLLIAEKIFLTLIVVFFPISVAYALKAFREDTLSISFFAFPFIYSYTLMMGFYSFCFSFIVFFISIGYWLRVYNKFNLKRVVIFAAFGLLLYFCHIFAAFNLMLFVGVGTLWIVGQSCFCGNKESCNLTKIVQIIRDYAVPPFISLMPIILLVFLFIGKNGASLPQEINLMERVLHILVFTPVWSLSPIDLVFGCIINVIFFSLFIKCLILKNCHTSLQRNGLLFIFFFYVVLFVFVPGATTGSVYIVDRLIPYVFFSLLIWLGAQPLSHGFVQKFAIIVASLSFVLVGYRVPQFAELNNYIAEYLSVAEKIEPNRTVLPLSVSRVRRESDDSFLADRVFPFLHAAGHIAAQRHVVDLKNYQAGHEHFFPIEYRAHLNPYKQLSESIEKIPPELFSLNYRPGTGGEIDYVLLWGSVEDAADNLKVKSLLNEISNNYDLISVSQKRGLMHLYRRKGEG